MKLTKNQQLLVHNVLFGYLTDHPSLEVMVKNEILDVMQHLQDSLTVFPTRSFHEDDEDLDAPSDEDDLEEEHEDLDEDDCYEAKAHLELDDFTSLPPLRADDHSQDEKERVTLRFVEENGKLGAEISTDDDLFEVINDVKLVTRGGKFVLLETRDEDRHFDVSKFPPEWTSVLKVNIPTACN
jgi:hypothetical protein